MKKSINMGGEIRRPNYAVLLPNNFKVLCRAGMSLGISTIISRKEADKTGIEYLKPNRWESSEIFLYPNREVRDTKGRFYGTILGFCQDRFSEPSQYGGGEYGGAPHNIFIRKRCGEIVEVTFNGEERAMTPEDVACRRLHWTESSEIAGKSYPDRDEFLVKIEEAAKLPAALLKAALELQKLRSNN